MPAPLVLSPPPVTPIVQVLLTNIAALYAYLAINESLILRLSDDMAVWKAVIAALVITDAGHVYGVYAAAPDRSTLSSLYTSRLRGWSAVDIKGNEEWE